MVAGKTRAAQGRHDRVTALLIGGFHGFICAKVYSSRGTFHDMHRQPASPLPPARYPKKYYDPIAGTGQFGGIPQDQQQPFVSSPSHRTLPPGKGHPHPWREHHRPIPPLRQRALVGFPDFLPLAVPAVTATPLAVCAGGTICKFFPAWFGNYDRMAGQVAQEEGLAIRSMGRASFGYPAI